jgi:hypothetical protein
VNPVTEAGKRLAIEEVARWLCKSGYWKHVADPDRQWQICLREAEGLLFGEYGEPTDAHNALAAYLRAATLAELRTAVEGLPEKLYRHVVEGKPDAYVSRAAVLAVIEALGKPQP